MRTSFIIDLKVNQNGEARILEMGRALYSGYEGYKAVTGKNMIWDVVASDLKSKQVNLWTAEPDHFSGKHPLAKQRALLGSCLEIKRSQLRSDFIDKASSGKNIILWEGPVQLNEVVTIFEEYKDKVDIEIADSSIAFALCCESKANLHGLAYDVLKDVMPDEELYVFPEQKSDLEKETDFIAKKIKTDIKESEYFVLKPAEAIQGRGIIISDRQELKNNLRQFFKQYYSDSSKGIEAFLNAGRKASEKRDNFFVVQSLVSSDSVSMRDAYSSLNPINIKTLFHRASAFMKDDAQREPTIRMVLSYIDGELIKHGSYYKLSSDSNSGSLSRNSRISNSNYAAPVPSDVEDSAYEQLEPHLQALFYKLNTVPLATILEEMLHLTDFPTRKLATDIGKDKRIAIVENLKL